MKTSHLALALSCERAPNHHDPLRAISMPQWGEYQSLFQLSVALNTALAAFSDFLGNAPRERADSAGLLADRARRFQKIDDPKYNAQYTSIISGFTLSRGRYQAIYEKYEICVRAIRPICIVIALISVIGLMKSSVNYTHGIRGIWWVLAFLQFVPIMSAAIFSLYLSVFFSQRAPPQIP
jgi:hypothetical protein